MGSYAVTGVLDAFAMSAPIVGSGYRFVAADGGVFDYGTGAPFLGSMGGQKLNSPIVGMAVMPGGDGYYLVASDGGIFNYGSAQFYGPAGSLHLNAAHRGHGRHGGRRGLLVVASDGGIFRTAMPPSTGRGRPGTSTPRSSAWRPRPTARATDLVASDGGIFNYGDGTFQGSAGSLKLNKPVVGMSVPTSGGYYLVAGDGGIFSYPPRCPSTARRAA